VRESFERVLEARKLHVHATAATVAGLQSSAEGNFPFDVVIIASEVEKPESAQWQEARELFPTARLALTVDQFSIDFVTTAFEHGIDGVVIGDMSCDQVAVSLRLVALGARVIPSRVLDYLLTSKPVRIDGPTLGPDIIADLSARELEVLQCLVSGDANKAMARRLGITETMVKLHIKTILRKLNVVNRTQAAIWAVVRGINRIEAVPDRGAR
jgi:two-component system nitrate/nitrite response regulator NarL